MSNEVLKNFPPQGSVVSLAYSIGLLILAILGHGYLWTDAVNRLHAWSGPRKLIDALTSLCLSAFLVLPAAVALLWNGCRWTHGYFIFCVIWGVYSLFVNGLRRYATDNPKTLRHWRQQTSEVAGKLGKEQFRGTVAKFLAKVPANQALQLTVDNKQLAIPRLSESHEGLKIAHLSDLHLTGRIGPQWYEAVAEQVNQLQADAIAITGDIIENEACWPWLADSLGKLRARLGVYFILGNHDYYIDIHQTKKLLQDSGLICLSGNCLRTEWNNAPVLLAGNERPWNLEVADLQASRSESVEPLPLRLFLLHTPDQFKWACEQEADLALAGHTHGGQLRFPLLGPIACPSYYGTRYACGVFQQGNTVLHVSRGISGKTPLRWNCPPEIALLELVRS